MMTMMIHRFAVCLFLGITGLCVFDATWVKCVTEYFFFRSETKLSECRTISEINPLSPQY